jgi:hypothetical protein
MDSEAPLQEVLDPFEEHLPASGKSTNTLLVYTRGRVLPGRSALHDIPHHVLKVLTKLEGRGLTSQSVL